MLQHANAHTHPHTRVCMVYIYFCIGICWKPVLHQYPQCQSYTTDFQPFLFTWMTPSPDPGSNCPHIFASGVGPCSNNPQLSPPHPPSRDVLLRPLVPTVPIRYFCLPGRLWCEMPGQSPSFHCTKTFLHPLGWDPSPIHASSLTGPFSCHSALLTRSSS